MSNTTSNIVRAMLLPALIGLLAGIAGGFSAFSTIQAESLDTTPIGPRRPISAVTTPLPEVDLAERLRTLDIPVFPAAAVAKANASEGGAIEVEDAIGYATVLTSDGWLVTPQKLVANGAVLAVNGAFVTPKTTILDAKTGLAFLKIDTAPLQVAGFEDTENFAPATTVYAEEAGRGFSSARYSGTTRIDAASAVRSDEQFSRTYRLNRAFNARAAGGAVVTIGGNLAGILIGGDDRFIPIHHFSSVLEDAFRKETPKRAALGVRYLDLASTVRLKAEGPTSGALIVSTVKVAAKTAGFLKGDVILKVGDRDLTDGHDLGEAIMASGPGDTVQIEFLRAGERQTFEVVLQ